MTRARDLADSADKDIAGTLTVDALAVDGNVNIENNNPIIRIDDSDTDNNARIVLDNTNFRIEADPDNAVASSQIKFKLDNADRILVESSGDISFYDAAGSSKSLFWDASAESLGIGTTSPDADLHISNPNNQAKIILEDASNPRGNFIGAENSDELVLAADEDNLGTNSRIKFRIDGVERMRLGASGNVSFYEDTGTTEKFVWDAANERLDIGGGGSNAILDIKGSQANDWAGRFENTDSTGYGVLALTPSTSDGDYLMEARSVTTTRWDVRANGRQTWNVGRGEVYIENNSDDNQNGAGVTLRTNDNPASGSESGGSAGSIFAVRSSGQATRLWVGQSETSTGSNALTKASGSFKISHPLESMASTHYLVHSFVESPQCNNIYRGTATLSNGTATVNLDTVSDMSEGTFTALNTDIHVFTTNETDWDAVKGSVTGNVLTISCQNTASTATVSWLVIGERQDPAIISSVLTDDQGKLKVEVEKMSGSLYEGSVEDQ